MRNIRRMSLLALLAILLFAFNGCGDGDSEIQSNVITENDLFANPQIKATHLNTIVIQLEHPDGEGHDKDIGEKGVDEVPVYYSESVNHTFCWKDDTSDVGHSMELIDNSGNTVLTEHMNGECANVTITAGHYTMRFTHGGQSEGTQAIFIRLGEDNGVSSGIVNVASVEDNINTLITTNWCPGCDLSYANLTGFCLKGAALNHANLREASMYKATLSSATLFEANLTRADLSHADLSGGDLTVPSTNLTLANLTGATLSHANLTHADLPEANLTHADLSYANLTKAFLREADLSYANLTGATLINPDLLKAILNCAIWTDGTTCGVGSSFDGASCVGGSTDTCL